MKTKPMIKKIIGVVFIIIGLLSFVTPLTPGSWLIFIGLEFLGIRLLFWNKIKEQFKNKRL
ncbi:MAG: PGPGW domain-containing protein [Candidatus Paceibacterota bacterium]